MFGLGYLIKKSVTSTVHLVTDNKDLAAAVGMSTAFVATGGLSLVDEVIENGADIAFDGMTSNLSGSTDGSPGSHDTGSKPI